MTITQEKIEEIYAMADKLSEAEEYSSELIRTAKAQFGDREITVEREGKSIKIPENALWEEVYYLGYNHPVAEPLKKVYPEIFEASIKQDALAKEFNDYIKRELFINPQAMKISDLIKLVLGLMDYRASKGDGLHPEVQDQLTGDVEIKIEGTVDAKEE